LPTDLPRPTVMGHEGASVPFHIGQELLGKLEKHGQGQGVTLFMTLLAGLQVMLSKYTGNRDVAVGASIANRNHQQIEGLIGLFVNTLVLRTDLTGNPSVMEVLRRVKQTALD